MARAGLPLPKGRKGLPPNCRDRDLTEGLDFHLDEQLGYNSCGLAKVVEGLPPLLPQKRRLG